MSNEHPQLPVSSSLDAKNRSTVHLTPSEEQKTQWMLDWRKKVEEEISFHYNERAEIYKVYERQRDMYNSWLSVKLKKMKKIDKFISSRKKVLIDIDRELRSRGVEIPEKSDQPTQLPTT